MNTKILILSIAGKLNEPEDLKILHLYLLSLKENVIPYFDTKVILYNSSLAGEKTRQLVSEYGLSDIVDVRQLEDMELPESGYNFVKSVTYWGNRIGISMNMMFDYAKKNDFFGADWIFHTDSDIRFLSDFKTSLDAIKPISELEPILLISKAGDTNDYRLQTEKELLNLKAPHRLSVYNTDENFAIDWQSLEFEPNELNFPSAFSSAFITQQLKIRNDFFGMSRWAGLVYDFNWVHASTKINIKNVTQLAHISSGNETTRPETTVLNDWNVEENKEFGIIINQDKGSLVLYEVQSGKRNTLHIQLPSNRFMIDHLNGGWTNQLYHNRALPILNANYKEFKHIWEKDFPGDTDA